MIQLLYTLLVGEGMVVLLLILKNPMRKIVTMCLDRVKRGRGPVVVKTLVGVLFVLMVSSLHSIFKIQRRSVEFGAITPTDQVLMSKNMLESSLMGIVEDAWSIRERARFLSPTTVNAVPIRLGAKNYLLVLMHSNFYAGFCIFLALIIDRMHHYIREIRTMRKTLEPPNKQRSSDNGNNGEHTAAEEEKFALREKVKLLQREVEEKEKEAKTAEGSVMALKKQSDGFLLEYDLLLEENQSLRGQLQSLDRKLSRSDSKKNL